MPRTTCHTCGGDLQWDWEEAFDKFGFNDGDGQVMTDEVVEALREGGYVATAEGWGFHNVVITSISKDGISLIPPEAVIGYDDPHDYLPKELIDYLESKFDHNAD
jgi:hypothetical protein